MGDKMKVIRTQDGSDSLFNPMINESYHSKHGAIQESEHVFIKSGLENYVTENPETEKIKILEIGFGTGLNALLTVIASKEFKIPIYYHGLEAYPVDDFVLNELNYVEKLGSDTTLQLWNSIHGAPWNTETQINPYFSLFKDHVEVQQFEASGKFQICYFDAFAPNKQPEMWEISILDKVYQSIVSGGILVTYCAKGQFKRDLKSVGFEVESIPGPPGKREMVRGRKIN